MISSDIRSISTYSQPTAFLNPTRIGGVNSARGTSRPSSAHSRLSRLHSDAFIPAPKHPLSSHTSTLRLAGLTGHRPLTRLSALASGAESASDRCSVDGPLYDLVVVGGGPGGYTGAIRAAQNGLKVACVEADDLGGICLNFGCIPTKNLLAAAEFYHKAKYEAGEWGLTIKGVDYDWGEVISQSRDVVKSLNTGIGFLFKKNRVDHIKGHAYLDSVNVCKGPDGERFSQLKLIDPMRVKSIKAETGGDTTALNGALVNEPGERMIRAKNILLATGAHPRPLPGIPFDGDKIISYKEALTMTEKPKDLIIVGAGAIGVEFAYIYNAFDTNVTLVQRGPRILSTEDSEVAETLKKSLIAQGINVVTEHTITDLEKREDGVTATLSQKDGKTEPLSINADKVLVALGVEGNTAGIFPDDVPIGFDTGVQIIEDTDSINIERGTVKVDFTKPSTDYQTSLNNIFAIGDLIGPPMLAHKAAFEAKVMVDRLAGVKTPDIDYHAIPGCTYCKPQVASIGSTEQALKSEGTPYKVAKFPFSASGKAKALHEEEGFVKILSDPETDQILGIHMIGEGVAELSGEMSIAIHNGVTVDEIIHTVHAHPTLTEAIHEAALGIDGKQIHA